MKTMLRAGSVAAACAALWLGIASQAATASTPGTPASPSATLALCVRASVDSGVYVALLKQSIALLREASLSGQYAVIAAANGDSAAFEQNKLAFGEGITKYNAFMPKLNAAQSKWVSEMSTCVMIGSGAEARLKKAAAASH